MAEAHRYVETGHKNGNVVITMEQKMSNKRNQLINPIQPLVYQIRIKGHLGRQWTDWFDGLTITLEGDGNTFLTGPVVDQAALHGLLKKVRDLGMPLISVNRVEPSWQDMSNVKS